MCLHYVVSASHSLSPRLTHRSKQINRMLMFDSLKNIEPKFPPKIHT